jgi:hypothetical protein
VTTWQVSAERPQMREPSFNFGALLFCSSPMINGLERPIIRTRDTARMISDERVELLKNHLRDYYDGVAETWDATHGSESYNPYFGRQLQDRLKLLIAESAGKPEYHRFAVWKTDRDGH